MGAGARYAMPAGLATTLESCVGCWVSPRKDGLPQDSIGKSGRGEEQSREEQVGVHTCRIPCVID